MEHITRFLKGLLIGVATLIPGVSGGTMAIILGVYQDMIHGINDFFKDWKKHIVILGELAIGGLFGILLLSNVVTYALARYENIMLFLFIGIIFGGIPTLMKKSREGNYKPINISFFFLGLLLVFVTAQTPTSTIFMQQTMNAMQFAMLIVGGIVIAVALVLPGISASYVLLMLGIYEMTLLAIKEFQWQLILPIGIGVMIGTLGSAKLMQKCMEKYSSQTYMMILGFVLGSVVTLIPSVSGMSTIIICALVCMLGFLLTYTLGKRNLLND